jgi:hypothetical protein
MAAEPAQAPAPRHLDLQAYEKIVASGAGVADLDLAELLADLNG